MASVLTGQKINEILEEGLNKIFMEEYNKYKYEPRGYYLEQCGKKWRVMHNTAIYSIEPKTGWLTYKEADALLKIFKVGETNENT